ncbi:hypothetical protein SASPL_138787 [Salvia splendens]|uniref:Transmembrane protein n=1 Tax=Salvia splendens TaxID=180675 RepID=A0A8X8WXA1_SALSN|nr:hypothetical protein SASPL_138787 [Salvia splendens]
MAFQSAIAPRGWAEEDAKSSRTSTHPDTYMSIRKANTTAFLCSLLVMYTLAFMLVSILSVGAALVAVMVTFLKSLHISSAIMWGLLIFVVASKALSALYDDVAIRRPRVIVARDVKWVGLAQPGLDPRVLFHEYFVVRRVYLFWLKKKRRQQDLSADAFPLRLFYWIFDKLETRGYFRAADRFQVLRT